MRQETAAFSSALLAFAEVHPEVIALSADLGDSCELIGFRNRYPERYFNMGIAEQNMVSWAAGLAREGFRPVVCTFSVFLYRRALDQIEMGIASSRLPVILVGFVPGLTTSRGRTHQAINDVGVLRTIPGLTIIDCGDTTEVAGALEAAYAVDGPVYIRMLRGCVPRIFDGSAPFELGRSREPSPSCNTDGFEAIPQVTLVSSSICTAEALPVVAKLRAEGMRIRHIHVSTLKPFGDGSLFDALASATCGVVTYENHSSIGGLGSATAEFMLDHGIARPLVRLGIPDTYAQSGSLPYLLSTYGMDAAALEDAIRDLVARGS